MKKTILTATIVIAGAFASAVLISSCGGKKEHATEEHHHEEGDTTAHDEMEMDSTQMAYACPMHPEVTGKAGDACSKCGMKLVAVNADSTKVHGEHEH